MQHRFKKTSSVTQSVTKSVKCMYLNHGICAYIKLIKHFKNLHSWQLALISIILTGTSKWYCYSMFFGKQKGTGTHV